MKLKRPLTNDDVEITFVCDGFSPQSVLRWKLEHKKTGIVVRGNTTVGNRSTKLDELWQELMVKLQEQEQEDG